MKVVKIIFIRSENAFLPEINAYIDYFNRTRVFKAYDSSKLDHFDLEDFDVIWEFKGLSGVKKKKGQLLVHEYASLSTGKFPIVKNYIKSRFNEQPDLRIFLNETVKEGFNFNNDIDFCYRDMGIDKSFIRQTEKTKEYEFVYVGSISKERGIDKLLNAFIASGSGKLCLVGNVENDIYNKFKHTKNVIFTGKVPYSSVPNIAGKAKYGINYMPNKYPYNIQTSTKLLEYLALGLKIITTDYKWIREFEKKNNCEFYKLNSKRWDLSVDKIEKFKFKYNFNPHEYLWDEVIRKSEVCEKLLNRINN